MYQNIGALRGLSCRVPDLLKRALVTLRPSNGNHYYQSFDGVNVAISPSPAGSNFYCIYADGKYRNSAVGFHSALAYVQRCALLRYIVHSWDSAYGAFVSDVPGQPFKSELLVHASGVNRFLLLEHCTVLPVSRDFFVVRLNEPFKDSLKVSLGWR